MKFQSIALILIVLVASLATNQATPVDINDPHVIEIANFAVTEYNKENTKNLKFEKVINGVSSTINDETSYRLTLQASDGSSSNNYGAVVIEKPSKNYTLKFFALIHTNQAIALSNVTSVDVNDPHVIEIANFAVTEYNKENTKVSLKFTKANLKFEKVINGVSSTINDETSYRLTLQANDGSSSNNYGAVVIEKPSKNYTLKFFALIHT
ncbi:cysteine proteinase inhibitor [Trifolium repens]|nr:cysteine proteinase inhibitor [Trifolium repens]